MKISKHLPGSVAAAACLAFALTGCAAETPQAPDVMWAADGDTAIADCDDVVKIEVVNTVHQELFYSYVSALSTDVTDEVVQEWYDTCVKPGNCVWYMIDFVDKTDGDMCYGVWAKRGTVYMSAHFKRSEYSGFTDYELIDYEYALVPSDEGILKRADA